MIGLLLLTPFIAQWNTSSNVPPPIQSPKAPVIIEEPAPPVIINNKRAEDLTDDELLEFLQQKVTNTTHDDGEVQLLHIAPGYPLTVTFQEQYHTVIVGDPGMLKVDKIGRNIVFTALEREGDTSVQVLFPGNKLRVYHVFITPNFLKGQTAVRVASFSEKPSTPLVTASGEPDIKKIARIIGNYDALLQEKAIDRRSIQKTEIFRNNPSTGFTIYSIYRFADGPVAISFAYRNPYSFPIRYDESRLRIALGNLLYLPDYTSFHDTELNPEESTTGFAILKNPAFKLNQPFEIIWK